MSPPRSASTCIQIASVERCSSMHCGSSIVFTIQLRMKALSENERKVVQCLTDCEDRQKTYGAEACSGHAYGSVYEGSDSDTSAGQSCQICTATCGFRSNNDLDGWRKAALTSQSRSVLRSHVPPDCTLFATVVLCHVCQNIPSDMRSHFKES